jgi:hypothetical protein
MTNEKNGQVYQIGNQAYYIEVCFFNGIYETPVNLNMGIIEEINIKESLNQWWTTGFITLHNDYQFLEKGLDSKSPTGEKVNNFNLISDRPDGRNKFCIRIYPVNLEDVGYTVLSKTLILKTYVKFKFDTSNIPEGTIIDDNHWPLDAFCFNPEKLIYIKIDSDFAKNEEELELLRLQDFLNSKS